MAIAEPPGGSPYPVQHTRERRDRRLLRWFNGSARVGAVRVVVESECGRK